MHSGYRLRLRPGVGAFLSLILFFKPGEGGACCRFLFDEITLPECLFAQCLAVKTKKSKGPCFESGAVCVCWGGGG